jgi:hypothetical protein
MGSRPSLLGSIALGSIGMGMPGAELQNQAAGETDEERKRRLEAERQARLVGGTGTSALASVGGLNPAGAIGGAGFGKFGL